MIKYIIFISIILLSFNCLYIMKIIKDIEKIEEVLKKGGDKNV